MASRHTLNSALLATWAGAMVAGDRRVSVLAAGLLARWPGKLEAKAGPAARRASRGSSLPEPQRATTRRTWS
jgi:hypothetical protein